MKWATESFSATDQPWSLCSSPPPPLLHIEARALREMSRQNKRGRVRGSEALPTPVTA